MAAAGSALEIDKAGEGEGDVEEGDRGIVDFDGTVPTKLSPAARLFHGPKFNCYILAIMGCKVAIDPAVIKAGLKETLLHHPRFSSKMAGDVKISGKMKWVPTTVNIDDHVIVPSVDREMDSPDRFVEDYISYMTKTPLDASRPLWELHLLNVRTSDAEAVGVFRIHHSMGDGASLMSLLLACTRKTSNPKEVPSVPKQKRAGTESSSGGFWWFFVAVRWYIKLIWNTLVDIILFLATFMFLKDTNTPIKGHDGVAQSTKRFVHRTVSFDDIKLVKTELKMTVNDVLMGVTQGGLSRYLQRRYAADAKGQNGENGKKINFPRHIRLRTTILVNLRPSVGIQALKDMMDKKVKTGWGNWIGYAVLPFSVTPQEDPLEYVRLAKVAIDRKKLSAEAKFTFHCAMLVLKAFGAKISSAIAHRLLSHTSLAFSNVVGPLEDISFYGFPIAYLAPSVYGHPHALTMHFQSHANKMTISLAVDPEVIPDPYQLCADLEESLSNIKAAVMKKNKVSEAATEP